MKKYEGLCCDMVWFRGSGETESSLESNHIKPKFFARMEEPALRCHFQGMRLGWESAGLALQRTECGGLLLNPSTRGRRAESSRSALAGVCVRVWGGTQKASV